MTTIHRRAAAGITIISILSAFVSLSRAQETSPQPLYKDYFTNEALRLDLIHSGTQGDVSFSIEEIVAEPLWPETRVHLIDPTGYGAYQFRVFDQASKTEIYRRGYCTLFGEWLTTGEAASGVRVAMAEPLRMPMPKAPVEVAIYNRDGKTGKFAEIQRMKIDPNAYNMRRTPSFDFETQVLQDSGRAPEETVDLVILPDGYTEAEREKLVKDAKRFAAALFEHEPFRSHREKISVRLVLAFSRESGPDEPRKGIFKDTVFDTTFDTFSSPRYLTTTKMKTVREVASLVPYDSVFIMVNTSRYGGGGIYGSYSIFPSDNEYDEYVMIHEFGHGFGALGDEYFSSSTSYDEDSFYKKGIEPWEPNITIETDPAKLKWQELLTKNVPIPTPDTEEYDDVVGLFEGAGYKAKGQYRPTRDSKMFHKGLFPFGPVNERAIVTIIRYFSDPQVSQ